jgi:hypothetical protein
MRDYFFMTEFLISVVFDKNLFSSAFILFEFITNFEFDFGDAFVQWLLLSSALDSLIFIKRVSLSFVKFNRSSDSFLSFS